MTVTEFTIRVYGLLVHQGQVLVTDEVHFDTPMTKFPGGGLIPGEGTIECLKREFMEELGVEVEVKEHLYTTDYFQPSFFLKVPRQLISIYYLVSAGNPGGIQMHPGEGLVGLRWIRLDELREEDVTLPVDKRVVRMMIKRREEK